MWRIVFIPLLLILLLVITTYLNRRKEKKDFRQMQKLFEDELARNPRITENQR
jgi:uncharacterized protein YneF (UPF0154 family)